MLQTTKHKKIPFTIYYDENIVDVSKLNLYEELPEGHQFTINYNDDIVDVSALKKELKAIERENRIHTIKILFSRLAPAS